MISKKINNQLFYISFFLAFLGFYVVLLLVFNVGNAELSRKLTIPMRMIVGLGSIFIFLLNFRSKLPYLKWFHCFAFIYSIRIMIDYNTIKYFYISYTELIFFFLSFVIIPFVGLSKVNYKIINFSKLYKIFLTSALLFSIFSIFMYGKYIGQITRVSSNTTGESAMSPLILSYCGAVIIGVVAFYLLYVKKINKLTKYLSLVTIALAVIPFFLGASRGSIFAIFIPFFIMAISNLSFKSILKYILLLTIIIILLFYLDEYLGSGLLNRFMGTSEAIERGGSSASRLDIWSKSLSQFLEFPFFGDRLNTVGVDYYPHNIYIEVLQTTGVIGGIPFFVLVYKTIKASFNIFKNHREYAWIPVIFIQSVMRHMFSGALYNASWFWVSMTIVLSLNYYLNKNEK
jgi:O-antigen ligase